MERLYKLNTGDIFSMDIAHPPTGIPVIIIERVYVRSVKWWNPISWFKKYWYYKYKYIGD